MNDVKPCPHCNGSGWVSKPQWLFPTDVTPAHRESLLSRLAAGFSAAERTELESKACFYLVGGSATIFEACHEAKKIAIEIACPVVFDFNEQTVVIYPGSDTDAVARSWWSAAYHETPEQTLARR